MFYLLPLLANSYKDTKIPSPKVQCFPYHISVCLTNCVILLAHSFYQDESQLSS